MWQEVSLGRAWWNEVSDNRKTLRKRLRGVQAVKTMSKQHWYYYESKDTGPSCFLAFVNAKDNCSMRAYNARTGKAVLTNGKRVKYLERDPEGPPLYYETEFYGFVRQSNLLFRAEEQQSWKRPNLEEDCREKLPAWFLFQSFQIPIRRSRQSGGEPVDALSDIHASLRELAVDQLQKTFLLAVAPDRSEQNAQVPQLPVRTAHGKRFQQGQ